VWLSLQEGFFIPLDEIADILPLRSKETEVHQRADLIFVSAPPRRPLEFRFVEVKFRRHLRTARNADLLEKMAQQTEAIRKRLERVLFQPQTIAFFSCLRRSALARLLYFYLIKHVGIICLQEGYERLRRELTSFSYKVIPTSPLSLMVLITVTSSAPNCARPVLNVSTQCQRMYAFFGPSILLEVTCPRRCTVTTFSGQMSLP
jgi:hypothetical protein